MSGKYLNVFSFIFLSFSATSLWASIKLDTVPQTQQTGYAKTNWDDFTYGNPTEQIPLIEIPTGSKTGEAIVNFPIKLPEARLQFEPTVSIDYSNENGLTWLGTGWDIGFSSFTLDTRWGVPRYTDEYESEVYLFDGDQLGPVFHRAVQYDRASERIFHLRQESSFRKIIRHGSNPKNYWWEVKEKDGTTHYYGGTRNDQLSQQHVLSTPDGNIAEWKLAESYDINGNYISYQYQKINNQGGTNLYPLRISYNGYNGSEGNYSISFYLKGNNRTDKMITCRTGMKKVIGDILEKIDIKYKDQIIRSYTLEYKTGPFLKTLLKSITEYDLNNNPFYTYQFDYHNDVEENGTYDAYEPATTWQVPKDEIDITNYSVINNLAFLAKPTILGGAQSISKGINGAVTVGPPFNPATKDNSAGVNSSYHNTTSNGKTALVDLNGDGLLDKVFTRNNKLYFRPNLHTTKLLQKGFGAAVEVIGINAFSKSNTNTWSLGAEVNLIGFFGGYSHSESTTKIGTYFADFNGDELIDIGHEGKVYFNHLNDNGVPTFTTSSADTESPIMKGEPLDPSLIEVDPDEWTKLDQQNPLNDAVKVWRAPKDGFISIEGIAQLVKDNTGAADDYLSEDGVALMIQVNNIEYVRIEIEASDFTAKTMALPSVQINKNDPIYFRVHSINDGMFDQVDWNPIIKYIGEDENEVNADCLSLNVFNSAEEFLVSDRQTVELPSDGIVKIDQTLLKSILSDSVQLHISGVYHFDTVLSPSTILDTSFQFENIAVLQGDKINFSVTSKSNVHWPDLKWQPIVEYTSFADGSSVIGGDGKPVFMTCATVDYHVYGQILQQGEMYIANGSGNLTVSTSVNLLPTFGADATLSVKTKGKPNSVSHHSIAGITGPTNSFSVTHQVNVGDTLFAELAFASNANGAFIPTPFAFVLNGDTTRINGAVNGINKTEVPRNHKYRGWEQFAYNASNGGGQSPIILGSLSIDTTDLAQDTALVDEGTTEGELGGANVSMEDKYMVMKSDPKSAAWQGSDEFTFISATQFSSTRFGRKNIDPVQSGNGGDGIPAPQMIIKTISDGVAAGAAVGPGQLGGGYTDTDSYSIFDITDMNGDRYPDYVGENKIQFTGHRGAITSQMYAHNWGAHHSNSHAIGGGVGGSYVNSSAKNAGGAAGKGSNKSRINSKAKAKSSGTKSIGAYRTAKASVGISGNYTKDKDENLHTFLDINGDGLEDKLWSGGNVALNLGYTFGPVENWGFDIIRAGNADDIGGGVGFSISNGSIMSGVGLSSTTNRSTSGFTDVNDDALLDLIVSTEPMRVRLNTGSGFGPEINWLGDGPFDEGVSIGESVNAAGTFCLEFLFFRVCFNVNPNFGQGTSSTTSLFADIDGDGFPDYLRATGQDDNLSVRKSKIQRTNLLKAIENPLGGSIVLDYNFDGNTTDIPFSKWVLKSVVANDGLPGDGVDEYRKEYSYNAPLYDRHERQFYGFGEMQEKHFEGSDLYRSVTTKYHNKDYYRKGLVKSQAIYDADSVLLKKSDFIYTMRNIKNGSALAISYVEKDDGSAFPAMSQQTITFTEGTNFQVKNTLVFEHDSLGNLIQETDIDELSKTKVTTYSYTTNEEKYLMKIPIEMEIRSEGILYRKEVYESDEFGRKTKIQKKIDSDLFAETEMSYDSYGNILTITRPQNYKGERLVFTNTYDSDEHQYLEIEKDGYGYERKYEYEPLFNQLISSTDINENKTLYSVDERGRPKSITYPIELAAEIPSSISYQYFEGAEVPLVTVDHYDPFQKNLITTYSFSDGLGRVVQTKLSSVIFESNGNLEHEVNLVSGTEILDHQGRASENFLPIFEPINNGPTFNTLVNNIQPIQTEYDVLDRPTKTVHVDGGIYDKAYTIDQSIDNKLYFTIHSTDALNNEKSEYFDGRGNIIAVRSKGPEGDLWTQFKYDALDQVVQILDHNKNETLYTYDLLGRRTSVDVPDAGKTELRFDPAGNLTERVTATIRDVISTDGSIRYQYDHERLVQIDYPKYFQNKVQIHYGAPQDSFNRAGRIWLQEDATGGREYFFDVNGNPTKTIRTVMINRSNIFTYVSEAEYDTWGRILKMNYPDGEQLTYEYNKGGQLNKMYGEKESTIYPYIDQIGYDQYGEMVFKKYGNGITEDISIDEKNRVTIRSLTYQTSKVVSNDHYQYDLMDNLIEKSNVASSDHKIGGQFIETYMYDPLYRMEYAEGSWTNDQVEEKYELSYEYDPLNNISSKKQQHFKGGEAQILTSRDISYSYEELPGRPSEVGGKQYKYDSNGNVLLRSSQAIFNFDQHYFDEENRMIGASNNGYISRYTYDAFGRRTIKSHGGSQGVFINGAPAGFVEHKLNYRVDVSQYFTDLEHGYRKNYWIGNEKIISKVGTGLFQTNLGRGPLITAGGLDYKKRIQLYEASLLDYYAELGIPPGPPTLLALLGQPEINTQSLPYATTVVDYYTPPANWPNLAPPDTMGPPGTPVFYEISGITNATVKAGYNFTNGNITRELEQFYYHYDVHRSTQLVTDFSGTPRQHATYFPGGERWVFQENGIEKNNHLFAGKQFDRETGYYNLGDVYTDTETNLSLSIDPISQNFGLSELQRRTSGKFYYDYIGPEEDQTGFDTEILNSERPNPLIANASNTINVYLRKDEKFQFDVTRDEVRFDFGKKSPGFVKKLRREVKLDKGTESASLLQDLNDLLDAADQLQNQTPETLNFSGDDAFFALQKKAKKDRKKKMLKKMKRKQKNPRKVRFRVR